MFGLSLPPVVCRRPHVFFNVICVCLRIMLSNIYCVVFLFCFSSSCVPYAARFSGLSFFFNSPSVFSNVYLQGTEIINKTYLEID
jgi:hypothetical protein